MKGAVHVVLFAALLCYNVSAPAFDWALLSIPLLEASQSQSGGDTRLQQATALAKLPRPPPSDLFADSPSDPGNSNVAPSTSLRSPLSNLRQLSHQKELSNASALSDSNSKVACQAAPAGRVPYGTTQFWVFVGMAVLMVTFAGFASGMTVGLLSIDPIQLRVMKFHGNDEEKKRAKGLSEVLDNHHLLLVTLLLANSLAMEALPIFLDRIVPSWAAVLLSVTCILFFGEVIPQAFCTGPKQITIASAMAPLVKLLIWVLYLVAYPIAKLLDRVMGDHDAQSYYARPHLKALIRMHQKGERPENGSQGDNESEHSSALGVDEVVIIEGALDLANKTLKEIMIPMEDVKMLEWHTVITEQVMRDLLRGGHSRIPVYRGSRNNIRGLMMVKSLILVDPKRGIRAFELLQPKVPLFEDPDHNAYNMLNEFQKGSSHMAFVSPDFAEYTRCIESNIDLPEEAKVLGVATLEDVIEELIQEEIYDEFDNQGLSPQHDGLLPVPTRAFRSFQTMGIGRLASQRGIAGYNPSVRKFSNKITISAPQSTSDGSKMLLAPRISVDNTGGDNTGGDSTADSISSPDATFGSEPPLNYDDGNLGGTKVVTVDANIARQIRAGKHSTLDVITGKLQGAAGTGLTRGASRIVIQSKRTHRKRVQSMGNVGGEPENSQATGRNDASRAEAATKATGLGRTNTMGSKIANRGVSDSDGMEGGPEDGRPASGSGAWKVWLNGLVGAGGRRIDPSGEGGANKSGEDVYVRIQD